MRHNEAPLSGFADVPKATTIFVPIHYLKFGHFQNFPSKGEGRVDGSPGWAVAMEHLWAEHSCLLLRSELLPFPNTPSVHTRTRNPKHLWPFSLPLPFPPVPPPESHIQGFKMCDLFKSSNFGPFLIENDCGYC